MPVTGIEAFFAAIEAERAAKVKEAVQSQKEVVRAAVGAMMRITPVNSGETVRNYAASKGGASPGGTKSPSGTPGPTNQLPLGSEPNRSDNEAAAMADIEAAISSNKLEDVRVTNLVSSDKWGLIESGVAPGPPFKSRGPGGQTAVGEQAARVAGRGYWK